MCQPESIVNKIILFTPIYYNFLVLITLRHKTAIRASYFWLDRIQNKGRKTRCECYYYVHARLHKTEIFQTLSDLNISRT